MVTIHTAHPNAPSGLEKQHGAGIDTITTGQFAVARKTLTLTTKAAPHFIDLTEVIKKAVEESRIRSGEVHVFSKHTTAAIIVNEHEPLLLEDMADLLVRLAPLTGKHSYRHDDMSI